MLVFPKDLGENNLSKFVTSFGSGLDRTIEEKPRHSIAMMRFFRLRRVQKWPEDWLRKVQVFFTQVLSQYDRGLFILGHTRFKEFRECASEVFTRKTNLPFLL